MNIHFSDSDYNYMQNLAQEFFVDNNNFYITLFRVDIVNTKKDIYGETFPDDKQFLDPVKVNIILNVEDSETTKISNLTTESNKIDFGVFIKELEDKNIKILRGDYFIYDDKNAKRFYEINKISNINTNNSINGEKPYYYNISGVYVKNDKLPKYLKQYA